MSAPIYLVDGDQSSRPQLAAQLADRGFEVWPFDTSVRFLAAIDALRPSCILVDIGIDGGRGIDLIAHLSERRAGWPIIALDAEPDLGRAVAAMRAGAVDFVEKARDCARLDRALRTASASLSDKLEAAGEREDALARFARLTPREKDVANSILGGLSNKRAAYLLGISVRTVEMHRSNMMAKLGVRNMAEAAVLLAGIGFGEVSGPLAEAELVKRGGSASRQLTFAV